MTIPRPRLVLFDLDGTMVDSVPDLAFSLDATLEQIGLNRRGIEAVRTWVGNGVDRLVKRGITNHMSDEPDPELFHRAITLFREIYAENTSKYSLVYNGVFEGLAYLRESGIHCACVTNKAEQFTLPLLEQLKLAPYLELVVSGDTLSKSKPDSMPLLYAAEHFSINPSDCMMVGDSMHDMQAAQSAGFTAVAVPYGYNHGIDIAESKPDAIIQSIADLKELIPS